MKKKIKTGTIILIVVCFIGLSALLYPTVANFYNENFATKVVSEYVHTMQEMSAEEYKKYWKEAIAYNQQLFQAEDRYAFYQEHMDEYMACLDPDHTSIFGYIEIPKLDTTLPVYHTTSSEVLSTAIGHLEWTSLPTGGESTHCCVSGHRGLASAKLFTNLDILREGDSFSLHVLNEVLTYEIDQIRTVLPTDLEYLQIVDEMDYCTLITCTPYGINSHRLLVRGHRIENAAGEVRVVSEAVLIDQLIVAVILAIPILLALFMMVMFKKPENKKASTEAISSAAQSTPQKETPVSLAKEGIHVRNRRIIKIFSIGKHVKKSKH